MHVFSLLTLILCTVLLLAKDPYEVMGLQRGTSINEVKLKFRELSKKYHPDKNKDPRADGKYKEITDAY